MVKEDMIRTWATSGFLLRENWLSSLSLDNKFGRLIETERGRRSCESGENGLQRMGEWNGTARRARR